MSKDSLQAELNMPGLSSGVMILEYQKFLRKAYDEGNLTTLLPVLRIYIVKTERKSTINSTLMMLVSQRWSGAAAVHCIAAASFIFRAQIYFVQTRLYSKFGSKRIVLFVANVERTLASGGGGLASQK
jgi:hypothetical protein